MAPHPADDMVLPHLCSLQDAFKLEYLLPPVVILAFVATYEYTVIEVGTSLFSLVCLLPALNSTCPPSDSVVVLRLVGGGGHLSPALHAPDYRRG